jgi:hypothetical protein
VLAPVLAVAGGEPLPLRPHPVHPWRPRLPRRRPRRPGPHGAYPGQENRGARIRQADAAAQAAETARDAALPAHWTDTTLRTGDETYAVVREALIVSDDICPGSGGLLIRFDLLTASRLTQALAALRDQLTAVRARYARSVPTPDLRRS